MDIMEVQFSNRHYHLQGDMIEWCEKHIGKNPENNWVYADPGDWDNRIWCVSSMFGNTSFFFKNPVHATAFSLKWL